MPPTSTPRPSLPPAELPRRVSAPELATTALPERETILDPILAQKSLMMLYGPRGLGKTHVALGIAWAAASGQRFLKWTADRPHRVVYVDGEMAAVDLQSRLRALGSMPPSLDFLIADLNPMSGIADLCTNAGLATLIRAWGANPELLVLDNLASLVGLRSNSPDRWGEFQHFLMTLRRQNIAVLMLHHANKEGDQRGTSQREDVLDVVVSMQRPIDYSPQQGARFELRFEKARGLLGDSVEPIEAWLETDNIGVQRWRWQAAKLSEIERFKTLLQEGLNPGEIARELGISRARSYRLSRQLANVSQNERQT